ncbi:Uncharacterized protein TCM_010476 [Theobroma cacao]|uniref:Uncharacterized protein n=1 Tax=Theobroma cacao TaxID=3641 RepID=A0A061EE70_THECC|nr:Uncharacterized protein TCM_010476 [Theobroma cacao]
MGNGILKACGITSLNAFAFENTSYSIARKLLQIYSLLSDIHTVELSNFDNGRITLTTKEEILIAWKASPVDWISLNTEGAIHVSTSPATARGVLRDWTVQWRGGCATRL